MSPGDVIVRFEPALDRCVDIAAGTRLAKWKDGRLLELTKAGQDCVDAIKETDALEGERAFLDAIGFQVSQVFVDSLMERR